MNPDEALMLITYTSEKWGAAAALPDDPDLLMVRVQVWMDALGDLEPTLVRSVLAQAREEFPPNVATIRRRADDLDGNAPALPSWDEFWPWVRSLARRCTDYLPERGESREVECPWPALARMVSADQLAAWASEGLTEHDLEMVVQAHMRRLFDARTARAERESTSDVPALASWKQTVAALADSKTLAALEAS